MFERIIIAGHLGRNPEMRFTSAGKAVTNFSLATNRKWKDADGEWQEETIWWRVTVWGKAAESANERLSKGSPVLVEGRMNPDKDTGGPRVYQRKDGSWGASYELTANIVRSLGRGAQAGEQPSGYQEQEEVPF